MEKRQAPAFIIVTTIEMPGVAEKALEGDLHLLCR